MKRRLTLITEIIAPYRIPVFTALAARDDVDLHIIFLSETDPSLRDWLVYKNEICFLYEVLPAIRWRLGKYNVLINRGLAAAIRLLGRAGSGSSSRSPHPARHADGGGRPRRTAVRRARRGAAPRDRAAPGDPR